MHVNVSLTFFTQNFLYVFPKLHHFAASTASIYNTTLLSGIKCSYMPERLSERFQFTFEPGAKSLRNWYRIAVE